MANMSFLSWEKLQNRSKKWGKCDKGMIEEACFEGEVNKTTKKMLKRNVFFAVI